MAAKKPSTSVSTLLRQASQDLKAENKSSDSGKPKIMNVLEYTEGDWGVGMKLFPAQRMIVKLYYGLPLEEKLPSDPYKQIQIRDPFSGEVKYTLSEADYLRFLYDEGRCNIREPDHVRRELVLAVGRRSGKTAMSGIFASYEVYRLLNLYNPQEYYGLPNGNRLQLISVATDKDQASLLFNEVTTHLNKCQYFKPYIANSTLSRVDFRTPYDIDQYGTIIRDPNGKYVSINGKATVRVTFKSCNAKGLRGAGNIVVILDEVAHFIDEGSSSADSIYKAVTPSTAAFSRKDPKTGRAYVDPKTGSEAEVEARIILISSPLGKSGKFFEKFDQAMRGGDGGENILAIQAPTWEINPTIPASLFREAYHGDPESFAIEYGAQFSDQARGWIEREEDLMACVNQERRPKSRSMPRIPHDIGIDIGLCHDGTAIAVTHVEEDKIVLDYHEVWYAGTDWRDANPHLSEPLVPYARQIGNVERLDFDEISNWIIEVSRRFHLAGGLFDRWNGIPLEQRLAKKGLKQFKSEFFTRDSTSKIYQNAKMLMFDERLVLYDWPIPEKAGTGGGARHSPIIAELLSLQAKQVSKNIVLVEAPSKHGAHDDVSDALVRAVWLSTERLMNSKHVARFPGLLRPHVTSAMSVRKQQFNQVRRSLQSSVPARLRVKR